MTESINDIAIKLSVHAEGVTAGFRTAAEEARGFQKEIERFSYAVDKGLNDRKFGPLLDAALTSKAVDERLAREKQSQEEFNAWYRAESEKEYQAWYAIELKKEQVREQQLADDRQRAINTSNAQNFQRQLPAETTARADENANLQRAIMERYALLDKEQRQAQLYAGNLVSIEKMKAERLQQVADQLEAQREADFAAYKAQLAQEEVAGAAAAAKQSRLERARQLDAKRAADDARRQALNDMRADMAERDRLIQDANAKQGTKGIIQQIRAQQRAAAEAEANALRESNRARAEANTIVQRSLTLNQKYAQQLAVIVRLNKTILSDTGKQALSDDQATAAKSALILATIRQQQAQQATNSVMARSAGGYGGMAMAMGQASYAAEDFAQVLSMGGGLNMALMSASNNLSMVVRALLGTSGAMAALAGVAVPAVLIATGMFIKYLMEEETQAKSTADALRDIRDAYDEISDAARRASQQRRLLRDIQNQTSVQGIEDDRIEQQDKLNDLLEDQKTLEEELAALRNQAAHAGGLGVPLDMLLEDIRRQMESGEGHVGDTEALILQEQQRLRTAYENMQLAIEVGNEGDIILAAREYRDVLEDHVTLFGLVGEGATQSALASVNGLLAQEDALKLLIEAMKEQKVAVEQIAAAEKALEDIEVRRIQLMEEAAQKERQRMQLLQDNIRFQLEATDAQKEAADIQNQLSQFLGIDNSNPLQGMDPNDMSAEQARQSAEFLELMWRNLDRQKKEILDEKQRVTPVGGLEQNTYQAQADAFRQVLEATNREEDPQLTRLIRLQETANDLLEDITGIRIVQ